MRKIASKIKRKIKNTIKIIRLSRRIDELCSKPTYYPEFERKSKKERWKDNFRWLCKYKELNSFYTSYGLDVRDFRNENDFLGNSEFIKIRNAGNRKLSDIKYGGYNYLALLRDKYVFASHVSATLGERFIPKTIGLYASGSVFDHDAQNWIPLDAYFKNGRDAVWKSLEGVFGDDVFLGHLSDGKMVVSGNALDAASFIKLHGEKRFVLQEFVVQHDKLRAFKNKSVNTIRIVTIRGKSGKIDVFSAFLRVGTDTDSFVDNRAKGGLAIGIVLETGELMKYAFPHAQFGTKIDKHPLSGIVFEGYELPYWQEVKQLVCNAHRQFYGFQSIGWDVAITRDGPVLIEGNDNWEIGGPQDTMGGLKKRWEELLDG